MKDNVKPESVWVMPVRGKYCEIVLDGVTYKIWKVNPGSPDQFGTQVPYDVAVYFLGKVPPIISLVPEIKNGEHTSPLLEDDLKKIQESQARGFVGGVKNYNEASKAPVSGNGSDEALRKALDLLTQQTNANKALQDSLAQLQRQVSMLEQAAAKGPPEPAAK